MKTKMNWGLLIFFLLAAFTAGNYGFPGCHDPCSVSSDCSSEAQYCRHPEGECEARGLCFERPEACPKHLDPVCGCDGVTYGNPCFAAMAGVSVDYWGECEGAVCYSHEDCCSYRQYCGFPDGECDAPGTCEFRPDVCPGYWEPVCGCDGTTYYNQCLAAMDGISIDYYGDCETTECFSDEDCLSTGQFDSYCHFPDRTCEGPGQCAERPRECPSTWEPVCGCDGQTYENHCFSAAAGVSVAYEGACLTEGLLQ